MELYGMLDSPYVRRTAISIYIYGELFDLKPLSVFSSWNDFSKINPIVRAPSLILNDGQLLIDSTLIIDFFEFTAQPDSRLIPSDFKNRSLHISIIGTALAACDKAIQYIYEQNRPQDKIYSDWSKRLSQQLVMACDILEQALLDQELFLEKINQVSITSAVVWTFIQKNLSSLTDENNYPNLNLLTDKMEKIEAFKKFPYPIV